MTNNQIKYMIEVAQTGSVNQAARNLFISQSALSNAIMSVEQEFGRKIFNRSSHGMTLTAFGKLFIAYITPIHQQLTQLYAMRSSSAGGNTPSLSIISNGFYYISDIVAAMGQSHQASGLRISLQEDYGGNVSDVIANGMADLGVGHAKALADKLAFVALGHGGFAAPVAQGRFKGFFAHDGAVHLGLRQAAQVGGNVLVGDLGSLFHGLALDEFRQCGTGGDGAGAAKGLERGVFDDAVRADFQKQLECVAAREAADFANGVGVLEFSRIAGMLKVITDGIRIFPHDRAPS